MGGKTDATNVIRNTKLAVITSISMDHIRFLGNSLAEIATVKSGIIKPHISWAAQSFLCRLQTQKGMEKPQI